MKADFDYSKERDYEDREDFFGKFGLSEHFYGEDADGLLDDLRSPPDALQLALPVEELHDDVNCRAHPGTCPRTPFPALCPRWRHVLRGSHFLAMPDSGEQETEIE